MLLSLLGACIVVGPFQGPEWEPVSGLLSRDHSCRSPRCCGNLLVLCLFLIWQVRHYWHQITRTHPSMKRVIKVPPQKWAVPSMRRDTCLELTSKLFYSSGKYRGLDAHVRQWAQKKRWGYRRSLRESGARYPLSWQRRCQCPPSDFHTPSKTTFCTTSFSSTCMLPQDSSRVWHIPWCLHNEHTHLIGKSPLPDLDMQNRRMEQPLAHSQEKLVPLEPAVSMRCHPASMTLAAVLPNLPSQRPQLCSREFLTFPSNQQVGILTWNCPQEAWAPGMENQILGREDIRETQAREWGNQRESRAEHAWEIEASGRQLPRNLGMEDNAETKGLECESQRPVISKSDEEILTPGWGNPDHMRAEHTAKIQKAGNRNQRKARGENSPEVQVHIVDNQELLRCKVDAENQTSEWGNQGKCRNEDAIETRVFEKNKKEASGEDEGLTQAQGLGKRGLTGSENGEELQVLLWGGKRDRTRDDPGAEVQAEERENEGQVGGRNVVPSQIPGRENLGEVKQEDGVEIQAPGWGKQDYVESRNVRDIQTPGWEKQDRGRGEKASGELQKQLRQEFRVGWGSQGLRGGTDAGEARISRRKNLREIREEDWVVIQTLWWEDQRPVAIEVDREFERTHWGNWVQIGGDCRTELQAPEKRDQRKDSDEDGINTLAPEIENQGQLRGDTHVDTHPPDGRNQEQFGDETSTIMQVPEMENLRVVKGEGDEEALELGAENWGQLSSEINGKIHTPKWKNQEHIRSKDGVNTQASDAENWGELTSKIDGETHAAEWKKEEQAGGENGRENQAPEKRNHREAGGEDGPETGAPGEENRSQLRGDIHRKTHLLEWKNQEQMGGENGMEIQAPEKRNQRELRDEDGVETQRPERENPGQLDSDNGESSSPGRRNWEQNGGKNDAEDVGSQDDRKIQRLGGANQKLLKSKVNGKTCTSVWKNQEQVGGENGAEIQIQGERNLRGPTGEDGGETQAPGGDNQEQLRSQIDGEIQIQGQENQKKGGEEDAAVIWNIESQTKCIAEDAEEPEVPGGGRKDQVRERDAAKGNLQGDCSGVEGLPVLTGSGSGSGAMEQEQAVSSATCPEMKPLPNQGELFLLSSGEGKHLASQSMAPARWHRVGISPGFTRAPLKPERRRQRNPGKASGLAWQFQKPHSLAASLNLSSCPSDPCGQAPQAATALVGIPSAHPVLSKWPGLKKSQQFLLECLMRRKIAHLKWDLRQQLILESHLLFNLLDPGPLPSAGVQFPGLYVACELQRQQERLYEAQASRPGFKFPEKSQRIQPQKRKSSKLCTQVRALEKCGLQGSEPTGLSIHLSKLRRVRPPGGPRERQDVQKEAPPRAKRPAPRNPRPAAEPGCGQKRVREPSSGNSRDRKMVRPGASQTAERAPSRVRTSYSRAGQDHGRKESSFLQASKLPRLKYRQPTPWRRESLEGRGAEQLSSSCSEDTSDFKGSLHAATASPSRGSPPLAKPQHSAPNPNLRVSDPPLLPKVGGPHGREDRIRVHTSSNRDHQPPGHCCAGAVLPKTESIQGQGEPENPNGAPQNPPASKKFGFIKHLRSFPLRLCFRK